MLSIFYGRESMEKDRFLFDRIGAALKAVGEAGPVKKILLLVPDQYTLQAERDAFAYLRLEGMMDLEILSFNRLAERVLQEVGGAGRPHIDKYGRHILLTKIVREAKDELLVFRGLEQSHVFIDMANDLISQMKQYDALPEQLAELAADMDEAGLLARKLRDLHLLYSRYEEQIQGKYIDTEDTLELFASKIGSSRQLRDTEIWVSGFDSFAPRAMKIMEQLLLHSRALNVVLTGAFGEKAAAEGDLFALPERVLRQFLTAAGGLGIPGKACEIPAEYEIRAGAGPEEKDAAILHMERQLYRYPFATYEGEAGTLRFCRAANFYAEAETAAALIMELVRDGGCRYRDIAVICNDMEGRGTAIKRVFAEYGIPCFLDRKRRLMNNPAVVYVDALLRVVCDGWQHDDVFRLVKTGFSPIGRQDSDLLENYAIQYKIKGSRWKKPFTYGTAEKGPEAMEALNGLRAALTEPLAAFEKDFRKKSSVREKTTVLYGYLRDGAALPDRIEAVMESLNEGGSFEAAEETSQVWAALMQILDQMVELLDEEIMDGAEYGALLRAGLEALEVGVLPPTADQVTVGTIQRTRTGRCRALLALGANDGVLPAGNSGDDLLSEDEKASLFQRDILLCKNDDIRAMEEKLAIYRCFSKPARQLWVSYAAADQDGKELKPSVLFDRLRQLFPRVEVEKDVLNSGDQLRLVESKNSALRHLSGALRQAVAGEEQLSPVWQEGCRWYQREDAAALDGIKAGLFFTNKAQRLEKDLIQRLYKNDLSNVIVVSPSRIERFSKCPFSDLVTYGLKPEELRVFEAAGREVGDIYHECLLRLSRELTLPGVPITSPESPWMQADQENCRGRVSRILQEVAASYKEGMLLSGKEEQYRTRRMEEVCSGAAWNLVRHVQRGDIREVFFEKPFGRGSGEDGSLPAIEVAAGGETVRIEGRIDRVDVLGGDYVKIIDYKSGKERFDLEEAKGGWRLQLMLYLKAALQGIEQSKPAGVFYFEIAEPLVDAGTFSGEEIKEKLEKELSKAFKLDGLVIDDMTAIEGMDLDFSGFSEILPLRKNSDGGVSGTAPGKLLTEEAFAELQAAVDRTVADLCRDLTKGVVDVRPKKVRDLTACKYCEYKSICSFDLSFDGCTYDVVK